MKEIILYKGRKDKNNFMPSSMVVMVDDSDFEVMNQFQWFAFKNRNTHYAIRSISSDGRKETVLMHREIMGCTKGDGIIIDHKNHNGLDCQRHNMRKCTYGQNNQNASAFGASKYRGVHFNKSSGHWQSKISYNKKSTQLGSFKSEIEAAKAYDKKALELHGEFANLNFK